ncbi:unnamed protein product [Amoebophrya sp. A25]|nr:unnamed protein product [Amoebophrya sp. A25]|eukprot:GSA25T00006828001.1
MTLLGARKKTALLGLQLFATSCMATTMLKRKTGEETCGDLFKKVGAVVNKLKAGAASGGTDSDKKKIQIFLRNFAREPPTADMNQLPLTFEQICAKDRGTPAPGKVIPESKMRGQVSDVFNVVMAADPQNFQSIPMREGQVADAGFAVGTAVRDNCCAGTQAAGVEHVHGLFASSQKKDEGCCGR